MNVEKWIKENVENLKGKTVAITGSNGGIISNTIKMILEFDINFIFINRSKEKTLKQVEELKKIKQNVNIKFVECDLSKFSSIKQAVEILRKEMANIVPHIEF